MIFPGPEKTIPACQARQGDLQVGGRGGANNFPGLLLVLLAAFKWEWGRKGGCDGFSRLRKSHSGLCFLQP